MPPSGRKRHFDQEGTVASAGARGLSDPTGSGGKDRYQDRGPSLTIKADASSKQHLKHLTSGDKHE